MHSCMKIPVLRIGIDGKIVISYNILKNVSHIFIKNIQHKSTGTMSDHLTAAKRSSCSI